ncbi:MAG: SRPBCC family protein [Methylovulum sp.]|nr:SRPBCC family protein [Methylovulum sp.]
MLTFPFDPSKPVMGKASVHINKPAEVVFEFVGKRFFDNYPKWTLEVTEFEPLSGNTVFVGAKARQLRKDQGQKIESIFEIVEFNPNIKLAFKGVTAPYRDTYVLEHDDLGGSTVLTFIFELLELELFMRPFAKLIRTAIEEGAENTVENIKALLSDDTDGDRPAIS